MRDRIEGQLARLLGAYERAAKSQSLADREAADAEGKQVLMEIGIDTLSLLHGINEHLGRIAIALEKQGTALPPAQHLFNQS